MHMTSTTERYSVAASQSASTAEKIADFWTQGPQRLSDYMLPGLPQVDLVPVVERYFEFVQRTVDISRDLTLKWAEAAGTLSGAVREQAESVGGLVREQAGSARDFVHEQAGKAEQAEQELAGPRGAQGRARAGQARSRKGPRALRGPDQGRAERPAGPAPPAQDRERRRARGAPGRGRQQVTSLPAPPHRDAGTQQNLLGTGRHRAVTLITEPVHRGRAASHSASAGSVAGPTSQKPWHRRCPRGSGPVWRAGIRIAWQGGCDVVRRQWCGSARSSSSRTWRGLRVRVVR